MPSIQRLTRPKPLPVAIDLGDGDTLNIVFDSNRITPAWVNETQKPDVMAVARALAEVILEWDVVADEQGSSYPPTVENLAALSYPAETKIAMRLIEAASPGSEEGNELSRPSSTTPREEAPSSPDSSTFPNGSETSTLPTPSVSQSST